MSLGFLAKKSFHTTNLDNVERVWIAEQKAEAETKKLAELQKQIDDERQIQELRQLQAAHGQKVKANDTSLDWMYQGPHSSQNERLQASEEYLLGKIFKPQQSADVSDFQKINQEKAAGSLWLNKINSKNDSFTRLHEDPLLTIRQKEKTSRENIINNPVKMARIYHELEKQLELEKQVKESKKRDINHDDGHEKKKSKKKDKKKEKDRTLSNSKHHVNDKKSDDVDHTVSTSHPVKRYRDDEEYPEENIQSFKKDRQAYQAPSSSSSFTTTRDRQYVDRRDIPRSDDRDTQRTSSRDIQRADDRETRRSGSRDRERVDGRDRRHVDRRDIPRSDDRDTQHTSSRDIQRADDRDKRRSGSRDRERVDRKDIQRVDNGDTQRYSSRDIQRADGRDIRRSGSRDRERVGRRNRERSGDRQYSSNKNEDSKNSSEDISSRNHDNDIQSSDMAHSSSSRRERPQGYGLIVKNGSGGRDNNIDTRENTRNVPISSSSSSSSSLGPNPQLLAKKIEKERLEKEAMSAAARNKVSVSQLSHEEKQRRLDAMTNDAVVYDQSRESRVNKHSSNSSTRGGSSSSSSSSSSAMTEKEIGDAKFLRDMRSEVYNSQQTNIEERLKQQRHYTQKTFDMESNTGFLTKKG